jgi:predicted transposase YdaD
MTYITTGERIGYERGIAEGKQEGKQEGEQNLVVRLLQKRVGNLPEEVRKKIQTLSLNQLESLGEALLDFTAIEDLFNWLESHQ